MEAGGAAPAKHPPWATPGRLLALLCGMSLLIYTDRGCISSNGVNGAAATEGTAGHGVTGDFHLSLTQDGILPAAFMVGLMVSTPLFALASRHYNALRLVGVGLGVWVLAAAGCGLSLGFASLLACRMAVGVGEASFVALAVPFIGGCCGLVTGSQPAQRVGVQAVVGNVPGAPHAAPPASRRQRAAGQEDALAGGLLPHQPLRLCAGLSVWRHGCGGALLARRLPHRGGGHAALCGLLPPGAAHRAARQPDGGGGGGKGGQQHWRRPPRQPAQARRVPSSRPVPPGVPGLRLHRGRHVLLRGVPGGAGVLGAQGWAGRVPRPRAHRRYGLRGRHRGHR